VTDQVMLYSCKTFLTNIFFVVTCQGDSTIFCAMQLQVIKTDRGMQKYCHFHSNIGLEKVECSIGRHHTLFPFYKFIWDCGLIALCEILLPQQHQQPSSWNDKLLEPWPISWSCLQMCMKRQVLTVIHINRDYFGYRKMSKL
jgi:hypothetical protein